MHGGKTAAAAAAIGYIEAHLFEKLDLASIAEAASYSKYHLHRVFTEVLGLTPRSYVQRRRLSEAARLLVGTRKPVTEIAQLSGYGSQQAFDFMFKAMYKKTPAAYRRGGIFYPLQLELTLREAPEAISWEVSRAVLEDLDRWVSFAVLVIDGFPGLELEAHRAQIRRSILREQVLVVRDSGAIVGGAVFCAETGAINFLAAHPQYRRLGVTEALLPCLERSAERTLSITTFRAGDKADTGQRACYERLGFVEAELLTEFGYPTQRMVLLPGRGGRADG